MNKAPLALVALLATTCATTSEREVDRLCGAQGRRFTGEAYGVGGLGLVVPAPLPPERDPQATGGARPIGPLGGLVEGTIGLGNLGTIGRKPPPPPPPPPKPVGLVLHTVHLGHAELGRDGEVDGIVEYASLPGTKVVLEATATVAGYGWTIDVPASPEWRAGFWLRCLDGRPRHVVDWTFRLRDGDGHRSEPITRPLTCTGEPLPGAPPRLEKVSLEQSDLVLGWRTNGWARMSGTHPPLELIGRSRTPGYEWRGRQVSGAPANETFHVRCRDDRGIHSVTWLFTVRDSYGRESNVIEKTMRCGECR